MTLNKDKALFWLNRRIRDLEAKTAPPDQQEMARSGLSYADRQTLMEKRAKEGENVHGELSSLREVVDFINEKA